MFCGFWAKFNYIIVALRVMVDWRRCHATTRCPRARRTSCAWGAPAPARRAATTSGRCVAPTARCSRPRWNAPRRPNWAANWTSWRRWWRRLRRRPWCRRQCRRRRRRCRRRRAARSAPTRCRRKRAAARAARRPWWRPPAATCTSAPPPAPASSWPTPPTTSTGAGWVQNSK